jgi:hypothetical protein
MRFDITYRVAAFGRPGPGYHELVIIMPDAFRLF